MRRRERGFLGGVCVRLAERFGCGVVTVRIVYVVLSLLTGVLPGLLAYAVLAFAGRGDSEYEWYEYGEDEAGKSS